MKLRYLLDENLSPRLKLAVARRFPQIDVLRVGEDGAPAFGTPDSDILRYLGDTQRALVTDNRESMPGHLDELLAAGGHHWGVFVVRKNTSLALLVEELYLYWEASEAEEWIDRVEWFRP